MQITTKDNQKINWSQFNLSDASYNVSIVGGTKKSRETLLDQIIRSNLEEKSRVFIIATEQYGHRLSLFEIEYINGNLKTNINPFKEQSDLFEANGKDVDKLEKFISNINSKILESPKSKVTLIFRELPDQIIKKEHFSCQLSSLARGIRIKGGSVIVSGVDISGYYNYGYLREVWEVVGWYILFRQPQKIVELLARLQSKLSHFADMLNMTEDQIKNSQDLNDDEFIITGKGSYNQCLLLEAESSNV